MSVVVDSSVLIDHLRGRPEATTRVDDALAAGEHVYASLISKVEILSGMRSHERRQVRGLFSALTWVGIDDRLAERAGDLARTYRASHPGVGVADYVIAATAQELDADLWTGNVRHFPMFPGLQPPYATA